MANRLKDVPKLDRDGQNLPAVVEAITELLQTLRGTRGDPMDMAVTYRELDRQSAVRMTVQSRDAGGLATPQITGGILSVGGAMVSKGFVSGRTGWEINGEGYAEFSQVIVRGTIYAQAGRIAGITIMEDELFSDNYVADVSGFILRADGTVEFQDVKARGDIKATSMEVGSSPAISGTTMTGAGAIVNEDGTFSIGNATGNVTFNGTVLTLNGELVDTPNVVPDAITAKGGASLASDELLDPFGDELLVTTVDTGGESLFAQGTYQINRVAMAGSDTLTVQIQVNGTTYSTVYYTSSGDESFVGAISAFVPAPPSGTLTVRLYISSGVAEYTAVGGACSLFTLGTKR